MKPLFRGRSGCEEPDGPPALYLSNFLRAPRGARSRGSGRPREVLS